jgi:hypothetical protein
MSAFKSLTKKSMKINSRHFILTASILSLLILSGCLNFGGDSSGEPAKTANENTITYDTGEFSIVVPKDWEIIESKDFTSEVPNETVVVFRNNVKNENFTANVNIVRNALQEPVSTLDYAKMVLNREKNGLYNYKESRRDSVKISIGGTETDTFFVLFEAKKSADDKNIRYLQTYGVKGDSAYIVTGAASPQEDANMIKTIEDTVKSFKLK